MTDPLTGLKTHCYFREALDGECRRSARTGRPFSLIMMDLDSFKRVNDHGGHLEGDRVLTAAAALVTAGCKQPYVVARYGGDEFAILMPETSTQQAQTLAERLRAALEADHFLRSHGVTASIGIATFPDHGPTPEEILRVADSGMYLAKHCDGNCVRMATLSVAAGNADRDQELLEAYLGVAVKRMFSTGNDAFSHYRHRFKQMKPLLDTITALAFAVEAKDPFTRAHSQAVSRLAAQIAGQMGLSEAEIDEIRLAGLLHDLGKIHVPGHLLHKAALLTAEENEVMKGQAAWGAKVLEPLKGEAVERIRRMVRHHHERYDGTGYPDGQRGEDTALGARIVAVAEAFDVMVNDQPYKPARTFKDALAELRRCSGTQFDPKVVTAFLDWLEIQGDPRQSQ